TDSITLDTTPPSGVAVAVSSSTATDAAGFTTSASSLTASLTYGTDAAAAKLGEGAVDCGGGGYTALDGTSPDSRAVATVSATEGQKTIVACFRDAAGNTTSATGTIVLDT